ncbi:MAG: acyl-CoA dehydrogenase family protein [Betaproteobacteria bacterium]|nr:acyl-CoA dehydrogenase family protein [Betaproteobacteria bacterium]
MDFAFTEDEERLRAEIQAFIARHLTPEVKAQLIAEREGHGRGPLAAAFFRDIYERGWLGVSWPKQYGGQGAGRFAQYIVEEEFYRAGQLVIGGGGTGVPAVLAAGTEEQKRYYVPGSIRREISFCQGYSEPHCGTDLAGIRCRATRHGEIFIINGQKIYTTGAQAATHIYLMVRTDPNSKRHAGLSILLVPMNTPRITIRPLWTIQSDPPAPLKATYGEPRTNEVFFDNVEVPATCLLGAEGDGWAVAQRGLNLDRVGAWRHLISVMRDEDIVNLIKKDEPPTEGLRQDPRVRDKLAELWTEGQVCRLMTMRSLSLEQRGGRFQYEGSAEKVFAPEHGVRATEAISQILGPYAQLLNGSPHAIDNGVFAHNLLGAFQSTVNHGSVQVMRDQIARKGLGMPKQRN